MLLSVLFLAGAVASLLVADGINPAPQRADLGVLRVDSSRKSRVLILLIDSWRHEMAIDSTVMPEVARLSHEGASGKMETVFEGFSIPAIRAAFSGAPETQLVNLIRNFRFRALPTESVFLDARRVGKRAVIVGDEPFTQFGEIVEKRDPPVGTGDMYAFDRQRPGIALKAYASGAYDLVLSHYESADWRAHETGIHSKSYTAAFAAADSVVARFAYALRPGDYLIVFGDHGHNEIGEHKTGLYIPTHALFVGPDVRAGAVFSSLPISDIRFIVDHALGIELAAPRAQLDRIAQFLPVGTASAVPAAMGANDRREPSRSPLEYLEFALFLALVAVALTLAVRGDADARWLAPSTLLVVALFVAELVVQRVLNPEWSAFPFLILGLGVLAVRADRVRAAWLLAIGLFFVSRFNFSPSAAALLIAPAGLGAVIPQYVAGTLAKLALLLTLAGRPRRVAAVVATAALALIEFRVWDYPWVYIAAAAAALAVLVVARDDSARRLALASFGYVMVYFTLRLPLYEYAWVDLFLLSVRLAADGFAAAAPRARHIAGIMRDALVVTGAFALTSVWLPGGLEWGFLYGLFPAYVIELQVAWFVPVILLKLPVLLLLCWWATGTRPTSRTVAFICLCAAVRFTAVWIVRLAGGSGALVWPIAEQAAYLTTFAIASVWVLRTGAPHERAN